MMWFMTSLCDDDEGNGTIQTPPEPRPSRFAATSQTVAPLAVDTVIASLRQV